jgi:gamma-glutamyltranspeptidase/glutathione hydrolase
MEFEKYQFPSRRSNIVARNGLVATSQPLAAQAGLDILKAGGNAIDAAIATIATLCVVEPTTTGIGGDAFALIWIAKEQKLVGINASGPAPAGLTTDLLRQQGHQKMPTLGPYTVTVPGSLRGWQLALERYGTKSLEQLLARPIQYARDGFPVSQYISRIWGYSAEKMSVYPDSKRVWLPAGRAPQPAELFRNPEFAQTLQLLANDGFDTFYGGAIGRQIADCVQSAGGVLTQEDLINYQAEWVEPISTNYQGYTFHEIPPNGQGLTALLALNIASGFDLPAMGYGTADYYHTLIEAIKLAFADAHTYIADPTHAPIPLAGLLSQAYTQERQSLINQQQAQIPQHGYPPQHGDTVYLTVADSEGNMISWIQSLYMGFGSGLTAGTTGIQLQNRGANFSLIEGHPNEVAPGKRPYNTIIPGFITKDGRPFSSFGVMGGFMQPQGHLQVGINLVQFGMDPQAALDAPRFNWLHDLKVMLETSTDLDVHEALAKRGHELAPRDQPMYFGAGQVIVRDPDTGVLIGGSEPRNDGAAVGY